MHEPALSTVTVYSYISTLKSSICLLPERSLVVFLLDFWWWYFLRGVFLCFLLLVLGLLVFWVLWLFLVLFFWRCCFFFNLGSSRSSDHHYIHSFSSYIWFFSPFITEVKCLYVGDTNHFIQFVPFLCSGSTPLQHSSVWPVKNGAWSEMEMNSGVSLWDCRGPSVNVNV